MVNELELRLQGSPKKYFFEELLTNSIHFPLANILLELLLRPDHPAKYFMELDPYVIILACLIQAYFLGVWKLQGKSYRLVGNLIGPTLYTLFKLMFEGMEFFESPHHIAYWGFSLMKGIF